MSGDGCVPHGEDYPCARCDAALRARLAEREAERDTARQSCDELKARLRAVEQALQPFARFAEQWDRQPLRGVDDNFYTIHTGTEYEAGLSLSDCRIASHILKGEEKCA